MLSIAQADLQNTSRNIQHSDRTLVSPATPPTATYFDHLVFIIMENAGMTNICGSNNPPPCNGPDNPYMSGLANSFGIATRYVDLTGTSEPNYIGIMAATLNGCTTSCSPNSLSETNLVDRFDAAGLGWKAYMENQTPVAGCDNSDHGFYEFGHNPFVAFHDVDTNSTRCSKIVLANPANNSTCIGTDCALVKDLNSGSAPNFMWVTPNDCNNAHGASGCANGCTSSYTSACEKAGDNYLSGLVPNILNSNTFKNTRAALFITFDEGNGFCPLNGSNEDCMYTVWAGPTAKTNSFSSSTLRNHYAFTKTIETNWNLATMTSNDAAATAMTEFFNAQSPDFTITASPSSLAFTFGNSANSTITVSSLGSFAGTVTLSTTTTPSSGLTVNCTVTTITGGSGSSTCNLSSTSPGSYNVNVTGTSGSLSHSTNVAVTVPAGTDFTITATTPSPTSVSQSQISTITITPVNGFTGIVSLTDTPPSALTCGAITPNSITNSGTATVSCSATIAGNYTLTLTGTSGSLNHSTTVVFEFRDFNASASSPAPVNAGSSAISTITVTAINHFNGQVTLTDVVPSGLVCGAINPSSLTGSGTATVSCSSTSAGNFTLTITGTSGSLVHTATALFQYRNFTISASSPGPVNAGSFASTTVTVTAVNHFAGVVSLTDTVPSGLTCGNITPTSVTGSGSATVSCSATVAGNYTLTITGTSSSIVHTATAIFRFQNFTISISPPAPVNAGSSTTANITVVAVNGFTGVVSLNDTTPSGLTCGTMTPTGVTGSGTATVSCSATISGNYTLTVTGTSGSLIHSATSLFQFRNFTMTASSPSPANASGSASATITVTGVNHFAGVVSLTDTVPSGLTCGSITPSSVTGSGAATVSCTASIAGNYTLTLTGTSGSLFHTATSFFKFVNFTIGAGLPSPVNAGSSSITTITVTSLNHFAGVVSLTDTLPSGLTCGSITPNSVTGSGTATISCSANIAGNYTLTLTGTSGSLVHSATALFQFRDFTISAPTSPAVDVTQSATSTIRIAGLNHFSGTVNLSDSIPSGLTCGALSPPSISGSGTATVSCSATIAGNYTLTVSGASGSLTHSTSTVLRFQDFTINATSPTAASVSQSQTSTITVASINGFSGTVTLSIVSAGGLTCGSFTPTSITGSGLATISCTGSVAGNYTATVTGTSTPLVYNATATFQFRDFTISIVVPGPFNAGFSANSTITVSSLNHFAGLVSLTDTVPSGLSCGNVSPGSVTGSGIALLSCNSNFAGNYTLTVTGTNGALSHSVTAIISIQDYSITSNPASTKINAGSTGSSIITITSLNHFSGTISLSLAATPGMTRAINPASITGGSGTATLTFSSMIAGNYTLTITGSSGTLTRTTTVSVQISDFSVNASPLTITILAGSTGSSTLTVAPINGFSGTVNLTLNPPMGMGATIVPSSIATPGSSTLSASSSTSGNYSITIQAASGSLSHTISIIISVQDYSLSGSDVSIVAPIGTSTSSTLTIRSLNQYAGNLTLVDTVQPPGTVSAGGVGGGGRTLTFAPPAVLPILSINPQSFQLLPGGAQQSTLNMTLPSDLPSGNYLITIVASNGTLSHQFVLTLMATDFSLTATPNSATMRPGSNSTIVLNLQSLNFFQGSVTLTVTSQAGGPTGTLDTSIVQLTFYSSLNLNLTISAPANTTLGNYTITVQATSGSLTHTLNIPMRVTATGLVSILAKIFSPHNALPIATFAIFAVISAFATARTRMYGKSELSLHGAKVIRHRNCRRSPTARVLPYSSGLLLSWSYPPRDTFQQHKQDFDT